MYKNQKPTDWQKELFGKPVYSQQHNLSVTGGNEKTKVSFSATENKNDGLLANSGYERQYINFKLDHEISRKFSFNLGSRFSNAITDGAGTAGGSTFVSEMNNHSPGKWFADYMDFSGLDLPPVTTNTTSL